MLEKMNKTLKPNNRVLRGLIIVPTRELVDQVSISLSNYGKYLNVRHTKIQGGISKASQLEKLKTGIDIIVATPGRLKVFVEDKVIDLSSVNMIVLDEADTMLEMGFIKEIEFIFSSCSLYRQIMMFSATVSQNIKKLGKEFLKNSVTVEVSQRRDTVKLIEHKAIKVDVKRRLELLAYLINISNKEQILLFANTKEAVDEVCDFLVNKNIKAVKIHGNLEYQERSKAIKSFRSKKVQVLVGTDIAARGIDIKELPLVINYELPESTDEFTHRVGRTGRANNKGEVITILTVKDYNLFGKIERNLHLNIKREVLEEFELKDRQPRQKQMKKRLLSQKKGKLDRKPKIKQSDKNSLQRGSAKSKKTTKRDFGRNFRAK